MFIECLLHTRPCAEPQAVLSAKRPLPILGLPVSASCRKPSPGQLWGPSPALLQPLPSYPRLIILRHPVCLSPLLPSELWPPEARITTCSPLNHLQGFQSKVLETSLWPMKKGMNTSIPNPPSPNTDLQLTFLPLHPLPQIGP